MGGDIVELGPAAGKSAEELARLKYVTMAVYALQALSFAWGVTAIVGLIVNYVKREDVRGTLYENHFSWQIRTFWWDLLWGLVGLALVLVGVGIVIMVAAWIWTIYRVVKGWLKLSEGKPVIPSNIG